MGRQVNFYMLPEDEAAFLAALKKVADVAIVQERSSTEEPRILDRLPKQGTQEAREGIVLWNRSITDGLIMKKLGAGSFVVDKTNAEVIELNQCDPSGATLRSGRIWAELNAYDEQFRPVPKSAKFIKWYESVARWIRKYCTNDQHGSYVAPAARAWAERGGRLV